MAPIAQLHGEHEMLLGVVAALRTTIAQPSPPDRLEFFNFRAQMSKQLIGHLTAEDLLLYPELLRSKDATVAATAQRFVDEMGGLLIAYREWVSAWPFERIAQNWSVFVSETSALLTTLERRVQRENDELYVLVERSRSKAA